MGELKNNKNKEDKEMKVFQGKKVSEKQRSLILLNICITSIAGGIMATSLTTALPPIMNDLHIDVNTGQWLTSGFGLFLAIVTPFTSYLITRFKTKMLYCVSNLLFIVGLVICAVSYRFWQMMLGRIIQGCGTGLMMSMSQVIILSIYPPNKIGTAMGWYGFAFSVAPIIAPTLAGILVDTVGWRMIFVIASVVMGIAFIFALYVMENVLTTMNRKFDTISLIISAFSFGGITLAIGNVGKYDFVSYQVLLVLIIGLIATVVFIYRQLHQELPFLDLRILKDRKFRISTIATFVLQLTILGNAIIFPIYVQQIKHKSATISGLAILPGSIASAFLSPLAGKIYDKIGVKFLYFGGSLSLAISGLLIYFVNINTSIWVVSVINILRCCAIALFNMPVFTWGMGSIPKNRTSDATALNNSIRSVGGALGSALFVSVLTKVASIVGKSKENPDMFGFNVVYLIMSILGFMIVFIGIYGMRKAEKEDKAKAEIEASRALEEKNIDKKHVISDENTKSNSNNIDIVIDEIEKNTEGNKKINNNEEKSDSETVINDDSISDKSSENTTENNSEIDVIEKKE
ncbi:MFS general substrate transporter [Neocallimastix lanati (nom. inval.)]|jgi:EmrB/QacA subfamily drug resistance transporter|uniref:MFS general substrate transporter n=1 Tax=Neocallimastix californiae TaxID=1754190 RepID=A0A1Y2D257_9FUNG|nr:MFS general substrate transporter [Neocallimastix sp. JGI-2020a]ORY53373.1 MFS general substrate transporter [Neocallimastix californiae]|eukprot:ORY53373.1 MFS general substrate transporter [Neocallimastix californiae]